GTSRARRSSASPEHPRQTSPSSVPCLGRRGPAAKCQGSQLTTLGCSLAEDALGAEDEDQDQDREDDRLRPVAPRRVPAERVVEGLRKADEERAEHSPWQVADAAEDGGREGEEPE